MSLLRILPLGFVALLGFLASCAPEVPPGDVPVPPLEDGAGGYVGLSTEGAIARARSQGADWRVVGRDGVSSPATSDYRPERLNFVVEGGIVVAVTTG